MENKIVDTFLKKKELENFEKLISILKEDLKDLLKYKEIKDLEREKVQLKKEVKELRNFQYGLKKIEAYNEILDYYNQKLREHIPQKEI